MEKAIQVHQGVLARIDLTRAERAHALACLGSDFRKAGFLDRATEAFEEVLEADPHDLQALEGLQKLHEDQRRLPRGLRRADPPLAPAQDRRQPGARPPAGGDGPRGPRPRQTGRGARSLRHRADPRPPRLPRPSRPRRPGHARRRTESRRDTGVGDHADAGARVPGIRRASPRPIARAANRPGSRSSASASSPATRKTGAPASALAQHLDAAGRHDEAYGLLVRALEVEPPGALGTGGAARNAARSSACARTSRTR